MINGTEAENRINGLEAKNSTIAEMIAEGTTIAEMIAEGMTNAEMIADVTMNAEMIAEDTTNVEMIADVMMNAEKKNAAHGVSIDHFAKDANHVLYVSKTSIAMNPKAASIFALQ